MQQTAEIGTVTIVLAVVMFAMLAVALLIIIDHKAKMSVGERSDVFSIAGIRRNHPIWAWLVSMVLWVIIGVLAVGTIKTLIKYVTVTEEPPSVGILSSLDQEHFDEQRLHFHNTPAEDPSAQGLKPVCYFCHGEYPHAKKPMVRTLLNMHTQFIGCMTCHTDSKKIPEGELTLRWSNYTGVEVTGKPFGTDVNPKTGNLLETDDYFSKVIAFRSVNGVEQMMEIPENDPRAQEFLAVRGELTTQQQGSVKRKLHANVNSVGRFCSRCHIDEEKSYIPFRKLGFSDKRISAITSPNIIGIVQKYKKFYLPTLFTDTMNPGEERVLVGDEVTLPEVQEEELQDPRAWWRKTYDAPKK